jgi:DNA-binding transcriptional LysR family regulator
MFTKLFAESGLSLDRLRALLEVGAAGSIVKAANADPVRQSQYSRQIKELEDFFRTRLIERHGKGARLTDHGRELARISRFFLLGLSNFQRGCLAETQTFTIGAGATFLRHFLLPAISANRLQSGAIRYATHVAQDEEIERGLHDLTLDFGIVHKADLSRPLQTRALGKWNLELWVPKTMRLSHAKVLSMFLERRLPLVLARELDDLGVLSPADYEACLTCDSFLEARAMLEGHKLAAFLPDFLAPGTNARNLFRAKVPDLAPRPFQSYLAWNPRLLRLNPHATRQRDWLAGALGNNMQKRPTYGSGVP